MNLAKSHDGILGRAPGRSIIPDKVVCDLSC